MYVQFKKLNIFESNEKYSGFGDSQNPFDRLILFYMLSAIQKFIVFCLNTA